MNTIENIQSHVFGTDSPLDADNQMPFQVGFGIRQVTLPNLVKGHYLLDLKEDFLQMNPTQCCYRLDLQSSPSCVPGSLMLSPNQIL